jgi:hypothetical protein
VSGLVLVAGLRAHPLPVIVRPHNGPLAAESLLARRGDLYTAAPTPHADIMHLLDATQSDEPLRDPEMQTDAKRGSHSGR